MADPFAVAIVKSGAIVGHVPRRISSVCSVFLRRNGSIVCCITGSRRYSADLVQGGLEMPCTLTFEGSSALVLKAKALLQALSDKKNMKEEKEGKHTEDSLHHLIHQLHHQARRKKSVRTLRNGYSMVGLYCLRRTRETFSKAINLTILL